MNSNNLEIIDLNNRGIRQLALGRTEEAFHSFSCALNIFARITSSDSKCYNFFAQSGPGLSQIQHADTHKISVLPSLSMEITGLTKAMLESSIYVFNRPLRLQEESAECSHFHLFLNGSVVLFNTALLYHQRGGERHDEHLLMQAASLYKRVIKILSSFPKAADCHGLLALLKTAALNNQGHIYYVCGYYDEASLALEELAVVLTEEPLELCLEPDEISGYFTNVLCLVPPTTAGAA